MIWSTWLQIFSFPSIGTELCVLQNLIYILSEVGHPGQGGHFATQRSSVSEPQTDDPGQDVLVTLLVGRRAPAVTLGSEGDFYGSSHLNVLF